MWDVKGESLALPRSKGRNSRDPTTSKTTQHKALHLALSGGGQENQFSGLTGNS